MKPFFFVILFCLPFGFVAKAQSPQPTPSQQTADSGITAKRAMGEVKTIDTTAKQLVLKTDSGSEITVTLSDKTVYLRLAPGETTLDKASKITLADIGEGDRVLAQGKVSDDRKSVPAATLVVMNKADIAKKQEQERMEWRRRGILGVITALKPESREITISSRAGGATQAVLIALNEKSEMRRYAPDSIKFSEAKLSDFSELKVGDQMRALGDRNSDGTRFTAEKVVSGSFQTVAGTVTAVDASNNELKINNLQTKQPLTIVIRQDAVLRKFPGEMGGMMMRGAGAGPGGPPGAQSPAGNQPQQRGGQQGGAPGATGGPGRQGGGFNIQDMLERLPTISIADVKTGDTILVSSTKGADPMRLTAISLVSGADTLLNMMAMRQQPQAGQSAPNPAAGLGSGIQFGIGLP